MKSLQEMTTKEYIALQLEQMEIQRQVVKLESRLLHVEEELGLSDPEWCAKELIKCDAKHSVYSALCGDYINSLDRIAKEESDQEVLDKGIIDTHWEFDEKRGKFEPPYRDTDKFPEKFIPDSEHTALLGSDIPENSGEFPTIKAAREQEAKDKGLLEVEIDIYNEATEEESDKVKPQMLKVKEKENKLSGKPYISPGE